MTMTKVTIGKAFFAAALCFGLAACSTTGTDSSSGASESSATASGTTSGSSSMNSGTSGSSTSGSSASGSTSSGQWNQTGNAPATATPGTSPTNPSNADDNSVKK
jgi:hypothetical protein